MQKKNGLTLGYATMAACVVAILSGQAVNAGTLNYGVRPQAVVLIDASRLRQHQLPTTIEFAPGRFVSAHEVQRACGFYADGNALLYFPDLKSCEKVNSLNSRGLTTRLQRLTGRWQPVDPLERVKTEGIFAIPAQLHWGDAVTGNCVCPTDQPPQGASMCASQTRTAGTDIGPIEFLATDADTPTLSYQFSYQRDSDMAQMGLPAEITPSCATGTGTLQCTLTGTAPGPAGILQFTLDVSDGTYQLPLESQLDVLAVGDRIFANNFETPGCP